MGRGEGRAGRCAESSRREERIAMSAKRIVRRSRPRKGKTDWARLRHQTDEDIARAVASDPDAAPLADAEWVSAARVVAPERKQPVYLRLDGDVVRWFKESGPKYQTRINAVLRAYVGAHRRVAGEKASKTQRARSRRPARQLPAHP
jgi:uncharacterized protein (DUF4415 family)